MRNEPAQLDPILLEILARKVAAAANVMAVTLQCTSRSSYVKEAADYGTILARHGVPALPRLKRRRRHNWAGPCRAILNEGRAGDTQLSTVDLLKVKAGDTAVFLMPSAGGAGDLNLRAPEAV
jgi:N-methylhydantoinase B/oxoprolinase/acetone carboxylase alpha subunit